MLSTLRSYIMCEGAQDGLEGNDVMSCDRCQGLMVRDFAVDLNDYTGAQPVDIWRCVICGRVKDPVIEQHRHHGPKRRGSKRAKWRDE